MLIEEFKKLLHDNGYKATPQRIAIYTVLSTLLDHPTAEEIYEHVSKNFTGVSKATVYKTLQLFKELGIIVELGNQAENKSTRFDTDTSPHLNLICNQCGDIKDYDSSYVNDFYRNIKTDLDVEEIQPRFDIIYTCKSCSRLEK